MIERLNVMYEKQDLLKHLKELGIDENGTLLVHSSMKSIGQLVGGADTVRDSLTYMKNGLLVFPTHTWSYINAENPRFNVNDSPSCVGLLAELF
jgi:aminoglycoside 3-N-acetyltransferase